MHADRCSAQTLQVCAWAVCWATTRPASTEKVKTSFLILIFLSSIASSRAEKGGAI
jgi:hypothetical protein